MSFDLYADMHGLTPRPQDVSDIATRIRLLAATEARKAVGTYKSLVHSGNGQQTPYAKDLIAQELARLRSLELFSPSPSLASLPEGSWFLQFQLTLAKPWMSKDDDPFYVAESVNPVRKDKVFKVPVMAASSWKGLLRWTVMQINLVEKKDDLRAEEFAQRRLAYSSLFGDEKGEQPGEAKDFAAFLDTLKPEAKDLYRQRARERLELAIDADMPHYRGRLSFYPTFFDAIDVEVINPHSRKTRAGVQPIYLECVPTGAKGAFSLLYVPFDLIGRKGEEEIKHEAKMDLQRVAEAIKAMMLTYGFSAKRTSGFGAAKDRIEHGKLSTRAGDRPMTLLSTLPKEVSNVQF